MELDSVVEEKIITRSKDMTGWIKFLGIAAIIAGGFYALSIVGIIVAWLPIWIGIILLRIANSSREVADGKVDSLGSMFDSLKTFFVLSGVLALVSIFFSIILMIIFGIAMVSGMLGEAGGFY